MNRTEMISDRERLRTLALVAGIPISDEELNRLGPLQEFLMTGLRRLHATDLGEREPVPAYHPQEGPAA
jgi:hypothetical protein